MVTSYCDVHTLEGRETSSAFFGGHKLHLYRGPNGLLHIWSLTVTHGGHMGNTVAIFIAKLFALLI